jgi:hypothetical protein
MQVAIVPNVEAVGEESDFEAQMFKFSTKANRKYKCSA